MVERNKSPYRGSGLAFQKEPQDNPTPYYLGIQSFRVLRRSTPKSVGPIPHWDASSLCRLSSASSTK